LKNGSPNQPLQFYPPSLSRNQSNRTFLTENRLSKIGYFPVFHSSDAINSLIMRDSPFSTSLHPFCKLKKNYPGVPVCVMTGDCSASVREKLEALGVTRYREKPFQYDKLVSMITEELSL